MNGNRHSSLVGSHIQKVITVRSSDVVKVSGLRAPVLEVLGVVDPRQEIIWGDRILTLGCLLVLLRDVEGGSMGVCFFVIIGGILCKQGEGEEKKRKKKKKQKKEKKRKKDEKGPMRI